MPPAVFLRALRCTSTWWSTLLVWNVERRSRSQYLAPSYRRAARIQVFFAALGFIAAVAAWLTGDSVAWLIGGLMLGGVIPFTLIFIMPTNRQLLSPAVEKTSPRTRALLEQWGRLHAVRSGLSLAALFIFIASA